MRLLPVAWKIVRDLGPKWALQRLGIAAQMRSGFLRRSLPVGNWDFIASDPQVHFNVVFTLSNRTPLLW